MLQWWVTKGCGLQRKQRSLHTTRLYFRKAPVLYANHRDIVCIPQGGLQTETRLACGLHTAGRSSHNSFSHDFGGVYGIGILITHGPEFVNKGVLFTKYWISY